MSVTSLASVSFSLVALLKHKWQANFSGRAILPQTQQAFAVIREQLPAEDVLWEGDRLWYEWRCRECDLEWLCLRPERLLWVERLLRCLEWLLRLSELLLRLESDDLVVRGAERSIQSWTDEEKKENTKVGPHFQFIAFTPFWLWGAKSQPKCMLP